MPIASFENAIATIKEGSILSRTTTRTFLLNYREGALFERDRNATRIMLFNMKFVLEHELHWPETLFFPTVMNLKFR